MTARKKPVSRKAVARDVKLINASPSVKKPLRSVKGRSTKRTAERRVVRKIKVGKAMW